MDAPTLLTEWLANSALRDSTRAEYQREITGFLTWCTEQQPPIDALTARPKDVAAWAGDRHLAPYLDGRPFTPDTLTLIAAQHLEVARSHDRRITALTQFFEAATRYQLISIPPNLAVLRSGVPRPPGAKNRLTPVERDALLQAIGSWGPLRSPKHYKRDQLAVLLLLEGLRPSQVIRVDTRHLYPQPDGTWQVRAPDDHENTGKQFTLSPLTGEALKTYLDVRPEPADPAEHALLLNDRREALQFRWVNRVVGQIAATHSLLADRTDTVTADAVAHTAVREAPQD